jgi:hypothetical protein
VWPCIIYHVSPKELGFGGRGPGSPGRGIGGGFEFSNFDIVF